MLIKWLYNVLSNNGCDASTLNTLIYLNICQVEIKITLINKIEQTHRTILTDYITYASDLYYGGRVGGWLGVINISYHFRYIGIRHNISTIN